MYPRPHPGLYLYHLGVMSISHDVDQDVLSEVVIHITSGGMN